MDSNLCPIVTDDDLPLRCAEQALIQREGWPHRVVWGLLYSPATGSWLVQWRRATKYISPGLWDVSWAGHVGCLQGRPESYPAAGARELREELGLEGTLVERLPSLVPAASLRSGQVVVYDLGYSKEYHMHPVLGGGQRLFRAHAHHFLGVCDAAATLAPAGEPRGLAWLSTAEIEREIISPGHGTVALTMMLRRCAPLVDGWAASGGH